MNRRNWFLPPSHWKEIAALLTVVCELHVKNDDAFDPAWRREGNLSACFIQAHRSVQRNVSGKRKKKKPAGKRNSASLTQMFVFARVFWKVAGHFFYFFFIIFFDIIDGERKVIRWDDRLLLPGIIGRVASSSYPVPCSHFTSTMTFFYFWFFLIFLFSPRIFLLQITADTPQWIWTTKSKHRPANQINI